MAWIHKPVQIASAERCVRLARRVVRELRRRGVSDADLWDIRDTHGARLHPASVKCGQCFVLVRPLGHVLGASERLFIDMHPGAYLQLGASDVTELIAHLNRIGTHWNR